MRKIFVLFALVFALVTDGHCDSRDDGRDLGRRPGAGDPLSASHSNSGYPRNRR